ncbi:flagellar biosynthesis protein FlhG [Roseomonas rosea]|uniref:Flagellar biosynthesis protein FlhG n=1 Tax=Muricoccus roseus TaxID=198092 RepID=A0A1M6QYU1_9PROT|nr:AAA family ATPase [Roseomonas rosea]SHK25402.1 flagellar biosynthesis protein FlhG [Roseomonas rosea]
MSTPRLIGIASGKGGVGKTVLAIGLAQALAQAGRRVLLADGDLGLANVDVQLGLDVRHDLMAVLGRDVTLAEAALRRPEGFDVLPGRSGSGALAALDPGWIDRFLALLRATPHDDVVLDIGAGLDPVPRRLSASCDTLLVVATDEPTSLTDAYAVLKLLARDAPGADARVVVNLAHDAAGGVRTHAALDRACRGFLGRGAALAGVVRRDGKVRDAIRHQAPLLTRHPGCNAARDIEALAGGLLAARAAA